MELFYSAFGLSLASNRPIPGLIPRTDGSRAADTRIWFNAAPVCRSMRAVKGDVWYRTGREDGQAPALRVWTLAGGRCFRLLYADGSEFLVDGAGSNVWTTSRNGSPVEDTATYLLGPVVGFVLRLRGVTCLHGSAVAVGDRAVALVGPAGAGKSTTAAAFGCCGYPILSDDVTALVENDGTFCVQPAYPQLRLWPESAALLFGSREALPRLTPGWDKRALDLAGNSYRFGDRPLPLAAVYILGQRSTGARPCVEPLHGREVLRTLLGNTSVGYLLDARMREQEFTTLGRLVTRVPVRRIVQCDDHPARLCARIVDDCEALACTASPTTAR